MKRHLGTAAVAAGALLGVGAVGVPVAGAATTSRTVSADRAVTRSCAAAPRPGVAGVASKRVNVPAAAMVTARLSEAAGNWDLAVFNARTGEVIAGSSYRGGDEVAQGFALGTGAVVVQACRIAGGDRSARVRIDTLALTEPAARLQLVRVATPTDESKDELTSLGVDLTEHGGPGFVDVVLHSPTEGALLNERGFGYRVLEADLLERSLADRAADRRLERVGRAASGLPSGRTGTYRQLFEYSEELQALAAENKGLVRYFTLPHETFEGRPVEAIEIAPRVGRKDGRPAFLIMGTHHAREWPSSEHTLEFAYQLINGWNAGNQRIRRLMRRARVIVVPVVNPDGFNISRTAGEALGAGGGRDAPGGEELVNLVIPYEYHRKNCRFVPPLEEQGGSCAQVPNLGLTQFGVDPNRNYGGFWGGPGASASDALPFGFTAQDYRGPGPFSEPETQNVRELMSTRQVVTMITNHTFSNLVLRPPGLQAQGKPPDERIYKRLGDAMAAENGYKSQRSYQLYDTSGTTEDWSYYSTGGLGFTFEIGPDAFHPSYQSVIDEYLGTTAAAGEGGGNKVAFLKALRSTVNAERHSVIGGRAPGGALLTLTKRFKTPTSSVLDGAGEEGDVILLDDKLRTTMRVGHTGRFRWHVNPSTRPLVDPRRKIPQARAGEPSEPVEFSGDATTATPCADFDTEDPGCFNDHPFTVPGGEGVDNGTATVSIHWPDPLSDWDLKVFRDTDGDGSSEGETDVLGSSGTAPSNFEETTLARPGLRAGKYVARVINYAAASPYEGSITFGKTPGSEIKLRRERWTLTCRSAPGRPVLARRKVLVKRGESVKVNLRAACRG